MAGQRSLESLRFTGDVPLTDVDEFCAVLAQRLRWRTGPLIEEVEDGQLG
ncbi:MAG: hypothetical protein ACRDS9_24715 [Pseudonocardiaceae bacterium]